MLHQGFGADRRVVDVGAAGGEDFAEVVRRDVGRHADRDPAGAVDQDVGEARGQDHRLGPRRVVIGREIDRVLVDVAEQEVGDLGQPRLGVAFGRRRIRVHRAEIALAVDQRHAHRPALGHPGEGVVDRLVAVRVIVTHRVADDLGRLAVRAAGDEPASWLAQRIRRWTGFRPSRTSGRARRRSRSSRNRGSWSSSPRRWRWARCRRRPRAVRRAVGPVVDRRFGGQLKVLSVRVHARVQPDAAPRDLSSASTAKRHPRARTRTRAKASRFKAGSGAGPPMGLACARPGITGGGESISPRTPQQETRMMKLTTTALALVLAAACRAGHRPIWLGAAVGHVAAAGQAGAPAEGGRQSSRRNRR